jgi:hypothetical protein
MGRRWREEGGEEGDCDGEKRGIVMESCDGEKRGL